MLKLAVENNLSVNFVSVNFVIFNDDSSFSVDSNSLSDVRPNREERQLILVFAVLRRELKDLRRQLSLNSFEVTELMSVVQVGNYQSGESSLFRQHEVSGFCAEHLVALSSLRSDETSASLFLEDLIIVRINNIKGVSGNGS